MSDAVSAFIENINQDWQVKVCRQLDATIREAIPDAEARIQVTLSGMTRDSARRVNSLSNTPAPTIVQPGW